jgi:hypothetical protein
MKKMTLMPGLAAFDWDLCRSTDLVVNTFSIFLKKNLEVPLTEVPLELVLGSTIHPITSHLDREAIAQIKNAMTKFSFLFYLH